jgi:hypothetical protein
MSFSVIMLNPRTRRSYSSIDVRRAELFTGPVRLNQRHQTEWNSRATRYSSRQLVLQLKM